MTTLICGSLAYDTIMVFPDQFKKHILAEQIHILNVSFLVPDLRQPPAQLEQRRDHAALTARLQPGATAFQGTVIVDQPFPSPGNAADDAGRGNPYGH